MINNENSSEHVSAFSEPIYRRYFPASCFSTLGSWLIRFMFGWIAWELTRSAFAVGVVAGAMLIPTMFLSPLFGIVSDRINPRNGVLVTLLAYTAISSVTGLASIMGLISLTFLIVMATLLGIVTSAYTPMRLALIPQLVPRQALPSAIGYSAMTFNSSRVIGPAIGAWLISAFSSPVAFFVGASMSFAAALFLLRINGIKKAARNKPAGFFTELKEGVNYAASNSSIKLIFFYVILNGILGRTLLELLPAFSGQELNGTAETLATLSAIAGAGSIIGGLFVSRLGSNQQFLFRLVAVSLVISSICFFSIQWLNGLLQFCLFIFILSMISTVASIGSQALAQLTVDESYRGRVLSLWSMFAMGAPAIGAIAVGALAQAWGFTIISAGIAIVVIIILIVLYLLMRR